MVASGIESDDGVHEIACVHEGTVARDADQMVVGGASSDGDGDSAEAIEAAAGPASGTCIGIRAVDCQARDGEGEGAVVTLSTEQFRMLCEQNNAIRRDLQEMRTMIESTNATMQQLIHSNQRVTPSMVAEPPDCRMQSPPRHNPAIKISNAASAGAVSARSVAPAVSARATPGAIRAAPTAARATPAFRSIPLDFRASLADGRPAVLMRNPWDLHVLWQEYAFGVGGNKPAKYFTRKERTSCRPTYGNRKIFWDHLTFMIQNGHTPLTAIHQLYEEYGKDCPVTTIINKLRKVSNSNLRDAVAHLATPAPVGDVRDDVAAVAGRNDQLPGSGDAVLSRRPQDLHVLWHEYEFGVGDNKAAKYFSPNEQKRCGPTYVNRKIVWDHLSLMIRNGHTPQTAIRQLYEEYGKDCPVTTIINKLKTVRDNNLRAHVTPATTNPAAGAAFAAASTDTVAPVATAGDTSAAPLATLGDTSPVPAGEVYDDVAVAAGRNNQLPGSGDAVLSRRPQDLHVLWHEYEFGVGDNKAAKYFSPDEQKRCGPTYVNRKIVWDHLTLMIRNGHTPQTAIHQLYEEYGKDCPVTTIISKLKEVRDNNLRAYVTATATTPSADAGIAAAAVADTPAPVPAGEVCDDVAFAAGRNEQLPGPGVAILSRNPRDLHVLWQEYEFGVGGNKPAKYFSREERNRCRPTYRNRKILWDHMTFMINNGHTPLTAIHQLYEEYGKNCPVTTIINELRKVSHRNHRTGVTAAVTTLAVPASAPAPAPAPAMAEIVLQDI